MKSNRDISSTIIFYLFSIFVVLITGCEDPEEVDSRNNDDNRRLNILITQEMDSTTVDTLFISDVIDLSTFTISESHPSTKEIKFIKSEHSELPYYIVRYNDHGTIIYWLEGVESSDWFPHWTYENWQAKCLTSFQGVYYSADSINATLSAFLIEGSVIDSIESVSLDLRYGSHADSLLIDATTNVLSLDNWYYFNANDLPPFDSTLNTRLEIQDFNYVDGVYPIMLIKESTWPYWSANYVRNGYVDWWDTVFYLATDIDPNVLEGIYFSYVKY